MAAPVDATASLQQVLAQLEALRLENQRLQSLVAGRGAYLRVGEEDTEMGSVAAARCAVAAARPCPSLF